MAKQKICPKPGEVLRTRAKKFLAKPEAELRQIPPTEIRKLAHELQLHHIELDMQNAELRRSQGETEAQEVATSLTPSLILFIGICRYFV